jgi:DNA-binding MarR family transcriptional regulator
MREPNWLDPHEMQAWRTLLRWQVRALDRLDTDLSTAYGLSLADYEILVQLSEAPEHRLRMSDLAEGALVSRSRLTHRVDRLVARGLVTRVPCPTDRRGINAVITEAGLDLLTQAATTHLEGVRRYVIDPLSRTTQAALVDELAPALAELERDELAAGCPEAS